MSRRHRFRFKSRKEQSPAEQNPEALQGRSVRNPLFQNDPSLPVTSATLTSPTAVASSGPAPPTNRPIPVTISSAPRATSPTAGLPPGQLTNRPNSTAAPRAISHTASLPPGQPPALGLTLPANRPAISPVPRVTSPAGQAPISPPIASQPLPNRPPANLVHPSTRPVAASQPPPNHPPANLVHPSTRPLAAGQPPPNRPPANLVHPSTRPVAAGQPPPNRPPANLVHPSTRPVAAGQPLPNRPPANLVHPSTRPVAAGQPPPNRPPAPPGQAPINLPPAVPPAGQILRGPLRQTSIPQTARLQRIEGAPGRHTSLIVLPPPRQVGPYTPPVQPLQPPPEESYICSECHKCATSIRECILLKYSLNRNNPPEETDQVPFTAIGIDDENSRSDDTKWYCRPCHYFIYLLSLLDCRRRQAEANTNPASVVVVEEREPHEDGNYSFRRWFASCCPQRTSLNSTLHNLCVNCRCRKQPEDDANPERESEEGHRYSFRRLLDVCCPHPGPLNNCFYRQQLEADDAPTSEQVAIVIREDKEDKYDLQDLFYFCCHSPTDDELEKERVLRDEAEVVIPFEEPDDKRKCCSVAACLSCFSAFLDCLCYQPQVRTVPSAYNPSGLEGAVVTIEQSTHKETVVQLQQNIVINLYYEVKVDVEMGLPDDEYDQSCTRRCDDIIDALCQAPTCKCALPCTKDRLHPKKEVMTKTLLKAKEKGNKMIRGIGYSFLEDFSRHIFLLWVIPEFVLGLIGFFASIATVSLDQNRIFTIIHLSLTILATFFATLDFFETFFKSFKHCFKRCNCKNKKTSGNGLEINDENENSKEQEVSDEEECADDKIETTNIDEVGDDEVNSDKEEGGEEGEEETFGDDDDKCCSCYKNKCRPFCKSATDAVRIILTEVILYPLLICDIFEVTTGRVFNGTTHSDHLSVFLFLVSCLYFVLYVYIARIVILVGMIRSVTDIRTPDAIMEYKDAKKERFYNRNIKKSAVWYQTSFTIHMILQMVAQILMFIAIGAKIRYDNRHLYDADDSEDSDESIHVSGHLWFMIISGFFLPFMGFLSFFVVTFHWTQEFPIGIYVDMISLMKMSACGGEDLIKFGEKMEERKEFARKIVAQFQKLDKDFRRLRRTSWCGKFLYPFKKPGLIILCMIYATLQLAFVLCAALTVDDMGDLVVLVLNGGGWAFYYLLAVVFGVIANLYVLLVVIVWVIIITITVAIAAIVLAVIAVTMWCYFACLICEFCKKNK